MRSPVATITEVRRPIRRTRNAIAGPSGWLFAECARAFYLPQAFSLGKAQKEIAYLEHILERMTYATFRKTGCFIGSGVVEAGCKTVIGQRMKCSGMFWPEEGGQGMLDLRCAILSNRLDPFCQARAAHHAARNDLLRLGA